MATHTESTTSPTLENEYTRLHITPFNPNLLATILPPSILPNARNISYHIIQTFPEKGYGYVELPVMDAEKIKKKLNGSILKGTKVRIEKARPEKEAVIEKDEPAPPKKPKKDSSKKRKRGDETIPAAEIGERQVKRGWTTPTAVVKSSKDKDKDKKKIKSKFTTGPECLFKTVLPPNVAANTKSTDVKIEKKKRKAGKEAVVHEFAKSTKYATFLRDTSVSKNTKGVREFVEGKGWVDEGGNLVEEVKKSRKPPKPAKAAPKAPEVEAKKGGAEEEESSDDSSSSDASEDAETKIISNPAVPEVKEDSPASSSDSSSEESDSSSDESSESSEDESEDEASSESSEEKVHSRPVSRPQSSSGPPFNLSIKIPTPEISTTPIIAPGVHPLEALYKKSNPDTEAASKPDLPSFSFFGADADGDEEMEEAQDKVPLTPFTQRDFEYRGIRSAAPTPDTAHANKKFRWPSVQPDEEEDDEEDEASSSPIRKSSAGEGSKEMGKKDDAAAPESDFQKWFYEHRGDTNRAWKKRRKTVAKEKRHRENKKRQERAT
ncbi:hypothetical protein G7Y89_g14127 [Cudoniella acicularis]|uniref:RRM domain-containing protein n=1 Tax=Cudoniella acicularis TaxID=354080 RepID=A0A8H4R5Y5_9HELO|nr:hypothetical protein G7Y89_g14127 [Cudoniella acicularis]